MKTSQVPKLAKASRAVDAVVKKAVRRSADKFLDALGHDECYRHDQTILDELTQLRSFEAGPMNTGLEDLFPLMERTASQ